MKTTASLMDMIQTGLINNGLNEFVNKIDGTEQITLHNDKFTFIRKVAQYDEDVQQVVNKMFFMNFKLANPQADLFFKHSFVSRFLDREIANQTVDLFANHLVGQLITDEPFITNLYENMEKYLNNYSENMSESNTNSKNNTNSNSFDGYNRANADLPQDNINLDLTKNSIDYANETNINRGFNKNNSDTSNNEDSNSKGISTSYNAEILDKINLQWDNLYKKYDKKLFLQVW